MSVENFESLKGHFLIAMPQMEGSAFANTLTYLCEHDQEGAMGLVINQPTDIHIAEIFSQLNIDPNPEAKSQTPVYCGGPVQGERGFILHQGRVNKTWDSTLKIAHNLQLTTSRDILDSIAQEEGPQNCLIALGYAGWGAGQLEQELVENCWLTTPADLGIIFDTPNEQRLSAAASLLGIRLDQLSMQAGHA